MRTNYIGHDKEYVRRRMAGHLGWDTADVIAENVARLERVLRSGNVSKTGRALEMGCGAGDFALHLAARGFTVSGVDIAPTAVAWALEKAAARGVCVDFQVGDVRDLAGFKDASFDLVLDGHCLHCIIGEDRAQFLGAARRVLKPDGIFVVITMVGDPVSDTPGLGFDPATRCQLWGDTALRYFGMPDDILAELAAAGFSIQYSKTEPSEQPDHQHILLVIASR